MVQSTELSQALNVVVPVLHQLHQTHQCAAEERANQQSGLIFIELGLAKNDFTSDTDEGAWRLLKRKDTGIEESCQALLGKCRYSHHRWLGCLDAVGTVDHNGALLTDTVDQLENGFDVDYLFMVVLRKGSSSGVKMIWPAASTNGRGPLPTSALVEFAFDLQKVTPFIFTGFFGRLIDFYTVLYKDVTADFSGQSPF
ncbi:hypothetical protein N7474_004538 [Penicillium riverlandense]|uniref:uncharacterized protein n=1 Tax=Penicillium riverlandense TaxID=1903569 RepID=UPI002548AA93|nr:uncharacterized protein N7474_004538 [Penicillium riverlandense]KAJ5818947.1 hypothetical protein N7474_004538 [Penicillium riverlandense]